MLAQLSDPEILASLLALALLEIVLGIDNIVFIAIMVQRVEEAKRKFAYRLGLGAALIAAFAALIGHMFPVWLKFKGGKGVATFIGTLLALYWPLALGFCAVWLAVALIFRISSLSAIVATVLTPLGGLVFGSPAMVVTLALMSALILYRHRENIQRLIKGEESKISFSKG